MNKAIFGIMAFLALAALCLVPVCSSATDGEIINEDGKDVFKVSTSESFDIKYTASDADADKKITFTSKIVNKGGDTVANAVSPTSGTLTSGDAKTLTVTVPKNTGTYRLVVEYFLDEDKASEDQYEFKAVNPIKLTVNFEADDVTLNLEDFGVYFYIDGEKMEDSYTTISMGSNGKGSVSYDWIADPEGTHTFSVKAVANNDMIKGLDVEHVFYAHDDDYSLIIAIAIIVLILLIVYAYIVYRKPIKNYGKPKARR